MFSPTDHKEATKGTDFIRILTPSGDNFELDAHKLGTIAELKEYIFENWPKGLLTEACSHNLKCPRTFE